MTFKEKFDLALQHLVPQHLVSKFWGILTQAQHPKLRLYLIRKFIRKFNVNMEESSRSESEFIHFNDFFTRHLKPHSRTIDPNPHALTSPCDGTVLDSGPLTPHSVLKAKGHPFDLKSLLGPGNHHLEDLAKGHYATIYLAPKDYHRVHMPYTGKLERTTYIPGKLFSVSPFVVSHVDQVFARNERLVCHFSTDQGPMVVIFVGAMIVSGIRTAWGDRSELYSSEISVGNYAPHGPVFQKGQEIGHFEVGSTVILLCPWKNFQFELQPQQKLRLGEKIGEIL